MVRNRQELGSPRSHGLYSIDDLFGVESNVLDPCPLVVVHILLNLRYFLSISRLVNRHFDVLVVVCYHD